MDACCGAIDHLLGTVSHVLLRDACTPLNTPLISVHILTSSEPCLSAAAPLLEHRRLRGAEGGVDLEKHGERALYRSCKSLFDVM